VQNTVKRRKLLPNLRLLDSPNQYHKLRIFAMELTPDLLINAYASGVFPMADPQEDHQIFWYAPDPRAILPLDAFYAPKSLKQVIRNRKFKVKWNQDFKGVMQQCANREETWISDDIIDVYLELHKKGFAHSVECYYENKLAGGLYGVSLGKAFFGESMFTLVTDASKVALYYLVERLKSLDFMLLDVQFSTEHLKRFGVIEIPKEDYLKQLAKAIQ
jgi:leucyl/phenylalanyl-tRNA---protein transferase